MRISDIPILKLLYSKIVFNRSIKDNLSVPDAQLIVKDVVKLYERTSSVEDTLRTANGYRYVTSPTTLREGDHTLDCNGTFTVTIPKWELVPDKAEVDIVNNGTGVITLETAGADLIHDVGSFQLYEAEALTLQKSSNANTFIVK